MKRIKFLQLSFFPVFFLTTCYFTNFYPDPDDPGLSRLTSYGYNIASNYINDVAYVNASMDTLLFKLETSTASDTLIFSWPLRSSGELYKPVLYNQIRFLMPVPKMFGKQSLYNMQGQRLKNVKIELRDTSLVIHHGYGNLHFIYIREKINGGNPSVELSGVFDGVVDDSVIIRKGRFDWAEDVSRLGF